MAISGRGETYQAMEPSRRGPRRLHPRHRPGPRHCWAIIGRGKTYRAMGRYEEALADFTRAIELDPRYAWAIGSRGETYGRWAVMTRPSPTSPAPSTWTPQRPGLSVPEVRHTG